MAFSRFPCRVCGELMDGADAYVVCFECVMEFELRAGTQFVDAEHPRSPLDGMVYMRIARTQDEIDASVRKLLDDW